MRRWRTISREEEFSSPPRVTTVEYDGSRAYCLGDVLYLTDEGVPGGVITNDARFSGRKIGVVTNVPDASSILLEFELVLS